MCRTILTPITAQNLSQWKSTLHQASRALAQDSAFEPPSSLSHHFERSDPPIQHEAMSFIRGLFDSEALYQRYHDQRIHQQYKPTEKSAQLIYDQLEKLRFECLGARNFLGIARNLEAVFIRIYESREYTSIPRPRDALISDVLELALRERLMNRPLPSPASNLLDDWRSWLQDHVAENLGKLAYCIDDQKGFNRITRNLIEKISSELTHKEDASQQKERMDHAEQADTQPQLEVQSRTPGKEETAWSDEPSLSLGEDHGKTIPEASLPHLRSPSEDNLPLNRSGLSAHQEDHESQSAYRIFTQSHDEIIHAESLCELPQRIRLRHALDRQLLPLQNMVNRLANRLQRFLMARQRYWWDFGQEEGMLDPSRLARVVIDPICPLSFRRESQAYCRDTIVSLLIDNSGSMRGRPITAAALSADILTRTLERCGVKVEILGFTTRAWKGGQSREDWIEAGKPFNPGRLNDLRHIIYKAADVPWRRARYNVGLILREGLLKENIDGEALLWAHRRLINRPEERRIIMVISDGAPVDDSTLSANPGAYLENHLCDVIQKIEKESPIELIAIGIGHDVTRYYSRAIKITDAEKIGGAVIEELASLFGEEDDPFRRSQPHHQPAKFTVKHHSKRIN